MTAQGSSGSDQEVLPPPALHLRKVVAGYSRTEVLHGISITVARGSFTALLGSNGAGKSTTIKVAAGLLAPDSGEVLRDGIDVTSQPTQERVRRGLCCIPEGRAVYRQLTVRENLRMQAQSVSGTEPFERALKAFPVLGQRLKQVAGTLSGGEQQMLALAAAYVRSPSLVLIDEPSLGLAPIITDRVFVFMAELRETDTAVLAVDQFAIKLLRLADHAYVLDRGEIVFDGSPGDADLASLVGGARDTDLD